MSTKKKGSCWDTTHTRRMGNHCKPSLLWYVQSYFSPNPLEIKMTWTWTSTYKLFSLLCSRSRMIRPSRSLKYGCYRTGVTQNTPACIALESMENPDLSELTTYINALIWHITLCVHSSHQLLNTRGDSGSLWTFLYERQKLWIVQGMCPDGIKNMCFVKVKESRESLYEDHGGREGSERGTEQRKKLKVPVPFL